MPQYQVNGNQGTVSTSAKGAYALYTVTTLRRLKTYEFNVGATGVPNATDCNITIDISRMTGTTSIIGSSYTPQATDPADATAVGVSFVNITQEIAAALLSTSTPLYHNGMNQRNSIRWVAAQESQAIISPATSQNGTYMTVLSPNYASSVSTNVYYLE